MVHEGNLIVSEDTTLADLTSVTGSLRVRKGVTLTAPHLTNVEGHVTVHVDATLIADHLTSISWNLCVYSGATLTAPQLTSVGWLMYVYDGAKLTTPLLTTAYGQPGHEIARCPIDGYVLWLGDNGLYYAGCSRGLTRDEALAHWRRDNPRAKLFTAAILNT